LFFTTILNTQLSRTETWKPLVTWSYEVQTKKYYVHLSLCYNLFMTSRAHRMNTLT